MRTHGNSRGFTLVELLTVIAIMAIVITIAFIQTRSVVDRQNVEKLIKAMHADLSSARMRAMQRNRRHFVFVDLPVNNITVYEDTNPAPEGDGILQAEGHANPTDTVVSRQNLIPKYPAVWSFANPFTISDKGLVDVAQVGTFRIPIPSEMSGSVDCVVVTQVKVTMGRWVGNECIVQ